MIPVKAVQLSLMFQFENNVVAAGGQFYPLTSCGDIWNLDTLKNVLLQNYIAAKPKWTI